MIEFLLAAGQWLGAFAVLCSACLTVTCASEATAHNKRTRYEPMTTHDWDALDGGRANGRHRHG